MKNFASTYGPWAVVTGASSGIGEGFARRLAAEGLNLVMLARRKEKMEELGAELAERYGISYRTASVDLSDVDFLETVKAVTQDLDIGLLVSNAGAGEPGAFLKVPAEDLASMLRLNVVAQMELSHYFAGRITEERGRGGLLLVSSMAAFHGVPYMANYSGAKAYILNLGEALNRELQDSGVHVSVLVPGPTQTPMIDTVEANMDIMPMPFMAVEKVVDSGLKALIKNKPYQVPGLIFKLMTGVVGRRLLPRGANVRMWGAMMKKTMLPHRV